MQGKDKKGRFLSKSSDHRRVRSIRATDETWHKFGEQAAQQGITRADLLEKIAAQELTDDRVIHGNEDRVIHGKISEAVAILQHGITPKSQGGVYRSNNAKPLKEEVVKAIAILEELTGDGVIHGKISEVVVILQHGTTSKSEGGAYRSNSPNLLKQEVLKAIAILEELTGLEDVESYVASDLQPDSDSNDTRQYTHSEVAKIVEAGRSTVGRYHEIFRGGESTGKSPVAKRIKDEGFQPSETHEHRWVRVK